MIIKSSRIYTEGGCVDGYLVIEQGKIVDICCDNKLAADIDVGDQRIIAGIFDTHNHGTMGYPLVDVGEKTEGYIKNYLRALVGQGVTSILPTGDYNIFALLAKIAQEGLDKAANLVGIHSEGPYLSRVGEKGIKTEVPTIDLELLKKMVSDSQGLLKLVAIAPELPGATEAIEYLNSVGVRCSYAHSDNNYQQALESFKKGVSVTTHTGNVMSGIHHREMGGLGACLLDDEVNNEIICDGFHLSIEMLELMFRVKNNPYDKFMMVSDNVPLAGAPIGRYDLNGWLDVNIDEKGYCLSDTGRLCGSTKSVMWGIKILAEDLGIGLEDISKMASLNPAKVYGIADRKGSITVGKDADFIVIDNDYQLVSTYVGGELAFQTGVNEIVFNPDFLELYRL